MTNNKFRKIIENSVNDVLVRLFKDRNKMDFVISQGGFEKYFQFEVAYELSKSGLHVHIEGQGRSDILIYEGCNPAAVIEMGAGFESQKEQETKPQSDYQNFLEKLTKERSLRGVEFYSLMILGLNNQKGKIPSNWKQVNLLCKQPVSYEKAWRESGFYVISMTFRASKLGVSASLLYRETT